LVVHLIDLPLIDLLPIDLLPIDLLPIDHANRLNRLDNLNPRHPDKRM
jgi:hypothetical protein